MKIKAAICAPGRTGFFFDDQQAIKKGALADGGLYPGGPLTEGFTAIRQAGESVLVMFILEDGQVATGDCAAVQYSGTGGRDPLFLADVFIPLLEESVFPHFIGQQLDSFKRLAGILDGIFIHGKKLHTALSYGVSQALLDAVAKAHSQMICQVVARENGLKLSAASLPIFTQSGDARYDNFDKMMLKGADVLPHGLINEVKSKLGEKGEKLVEYMKWMRGRAMEFAPDYRPVFHLDVYGTIGQVFGERCYKEMAAYLNVLAEAAAPFRVRIEGPVDAGSREGQMLALRELTQWVDRLGIPVEIVADEWCNTLQDIKYFADNRAGHMIQIKTPDLGNIQHAIEAVLYCKGRGVLAYQGGTCNETDRSAQICTQIAMATRPHQILAKPGMGVDEGFMIVYNEMQRVRAILAYEGVSE
ncbi:MAG: methylaspartate ammonia-lyase [Turicibacter sp.]|nr:methylaspartate ammonia-lyase [Turicibacter sp.]